MSGMTLDASGSMALRVSASMIVLVFVALGLRVLARCHTQNRLLLADIFILLSTACFCADQGLYLYAVMGKGSTCSSDFTVMTADHINRFLRYPNGQEITFILGITMAKFSILTFYRHIFITRSFQRINWVLMGICACWCLICLFITIFECDPVNAMWNFVTLANHSKCIPSGTMLFGFGIAEIPIDIMILAPPVVMVYRLQKPAAKRAGIMTIFLLGGFVCITCVVRVYYCWVPSTGNARSLPAALDWTTVELACAIVCACLPTYVPLFNGRDVFGLASLYSTLNLTFRRGSARSASRDAEGLSHTSDHSITAETGAYHVKGGSVGSSTKVLFIRAIYRG